jgi:ABC-type dipeptide/oligopeptide/nickel transport system permease component
VVEIFFDWPGLGVTMLNGIFQRETSVVAGAALGLGVTFLLINMSLDLIYRVIDPRLRAHNTGGGL